MAARGGDVVTTGTLSIERWDEFRSDALDDGGRLVHVRIAETLDGGIVGSSNWDDLCTTGRMKLRVS
jgi:hypothetical protein